MMENLDKTLDKLSIYELIDYIKNNMTEEEVADYLWVNYPQYADDVRGAIEARSYLCAMEMEPNEFD